MVRAICPFLVLCSVVSILSLPINSELNVKLNTKQDIEEKSLKPEVIVSEENNNEADILKAQQPTVSNSQILRQLGKVTYLGKGDANKNVESQNTDSFTFISIPILRQPFDDYKILVVTAPENLKIGKDAGENPLVIYVVLPDEPAEESSAINIPIVYFVGEDNGKPSNIVMTKEKADPVLVVDSNRTVTGLKSKEIEKYLRFKNKITSRYKYEVSQ